MSYTLRPEQVISTWIANVRCWLENGDVEKTLTFLGALESDWEKYQHGELMPMTIHTGNKMLIEHFEGQSMSITLFHCPRCDIYTTNATVSLHISATLDPKRGKLRVGDDASLPEGYGFSLEDIAESRCPECGRLTELVVLDECPHWWGEWQVQWGQPCRTCRFCNEEQQGKVVL